MPTVITQTDSGNNAITFDLTSLAESLTWRVGRESTQIDNTTNNYVDAIVDVKGITGGATGPQVGDMMRLYLWGSDISLATTPIDGLDGTDAAATLAHDQVLASLHVAGVVSAAVVTADLVYYFQPFSVASFFGGKMPKFWGLYFTHNMSFALAAAQSGLFRYTGITYTST